jgi:hypothetical protein
MANLIPLEHHVNPVVHEKIFYDFESEPKGRDQGRQLAGNFRNTKRLLTTHYAFNAFRNLAPPAHGVVVLFESSA